MSSDADTSKENSAEQVEKDRALDAAGVRAPAEGQPVATVSQTQREEAKESQSLHGPGAAGRVRRDMERAGRDLDFVDLGRRTRIEMREFDWNSTELDFLDWLLIYSFEDGKESKFVPNPQADLAREFKMDDGTLVKRAIKPLMKGGVIDREITSYGVLYRINPDSGAWFGRRRRRTVEDQRKSKSTLERDPGQEEFTGQGFDRGEALGTLMTRLGIEDKLNEEQPTTKGQTAPSGREDRQIPRGQTAPSGSSRYCVSQSASQSPGNPRGQTAPTQLTGTSLPCLPDQLKRADLPAQDFRKRRVNCEARDAIREYLGPEWRGNEGDWTDIVKFIGRDRTLGLIGDCKYAEQNGRIQTTRARWMKGVLKSDGILEAMRRAKGIASSQSPPAQDIGESSPPLDPEAAEKVKRPWSESVEGL